MPSARPFTLHELAERLDEAARAEMYGINHLELMASKLGHDGERLITEIKRQAEALAFGAKLVRALKDNPGAVSLTIDSDALRKALL